MQEIHRGTVKAWATEIVSHVEPDDVFVVRDGFDDLAENWHTAEVQDEGRFVGGLDGTAFAGVVVPFLLTLFGDVVRDVVKDAAKRAVGTLLEKLLKRQASPDETSRLRLEIEAAIHRSRFTEVQKRTLRAGFDDLFAKLAPEEG